MKIIKVDVMNPNPKILKEISQEIKNGKIVAYPTDTLYGLCTNPFDSSAVKRLFKVKQRKIEKGLPILVSDILALGKIAEVNRKAKDIIEIFWPGAITLILPKKKLLPDLVTGSSFTVAVRQPASQIAIRLARLTYGFIIGTSANISGSRIPPTTADQVVTELNDEIDIILDGGKTQTSKPSTIIDLTCSPPKIIREGKISVSQLREFLK
ncbi:MAG: L-threonylcarbamoyladenylate synthase [Candidatus Odinarchaeia archaeon]